MHILGWIVFGLIVGAIARFLMPGRQPLGFILTCLLGIGGAFVGGYIGSMFSHQPMDLQNPTGWLGAIVGSLLLLFVYSMVAGRSTNV